MIKILIVEDEVIIAESLKLDLEDQGLNVVGCASSSKETFRLIEEEDPDLLLLDIYLNDENDGIEIARKAQKLNSRINVIFVTGYAYATHSEQLDGIKYLTFLEKPVNVKQLIKAIELYDKE